MTETCEKNSFDKEMRLATKEIHSVSDALVNAKLAFALSSNEVWAEGLLVFYEIFRFLEEAISRNKCRELQKVFVEDMRRTEAFEQDLAFYLGPDWKSTYEIRDSVACYLNHLRKIEDDNPKLLIAYIYHLYMGLASGGQILKYKRNVAKRFKINIPQSNSTGGDNVTSFGNTTASSLKKKLRQNLNDVAERLSEDDRNKLIEESKVVFEMNNRIIRSVKSADQVIRRKVMLSMILIIFLISAYLIFIAG